MTDNQRCETNAIETLYGGSRALNASRLRRLLPLLGVTALAACSGEAGTDIHVGNLRQASQCGASLDWQDVESYDGTLGTSIGFVNDHEQAVGFIHWADDLSSIYSDPGFTFDGEERCTGTMISDDQMITAGHCFDVDGDWPRVNGNSITSTEGALAMRVDFNYQLDSAGTPRTVETFAITGLLEYRLGGLDYAIVRLDGDPGATYGTTTISPFALPYSSPITIIQHPLGQVKKVHAGTFVGFSAAGLMAYSAADTEPGSSGSGVLSNNTGYVSAIHIEPGCTAVGGANEGEPVNAIYDSSPVVRQLAFDAAKLVTVL